MKNKILKEKENNFLDFPNFPNFLDFPNFLNLQSKYGGEKSTEL